MKEYPVKTIAKAAGASLIQGSDDVMVCGGVSTDTRTIKQGSLFIALSGERFDAHAFLQEAVASGSVALLVEKEVEVSGDVAVLKVDNTLLALQKLARWYRIELGIPVVGITGSNGKTSTKDFTGAVLAQKYSVFATQGNYNNHIGVPLSILATEPGHELAIYEMGMNHPGEIAPLCEIAQPDVGVITNIGTAHIEHMGTRGAIAEEKGALARALPESGTLVVPAGCDYLESFRRWSKAKLLPVANGRGVLRAEDLIQDTTGVTFTLVYEEERTPVSLQVSGVHMVTNALLAAGVGMTFGLSLKEVAQGLESCQLTSGRLRTYKYQEILVVDDTYNANPDSMKAALQTVAELPASAESTRFAVLGPMAELGVHADEAHREVGAYAAERGLVVVGVGSSAKLFTEGLGDLGLHFDFPEEAVNWLTQQVQPQDIVLFKGSRAAAMEAVMQKSFPEN